MTNFSTKSVGNAGEDLACELLTGKGYAIVDRNVHIGSAEVDIVAHNNSRLIIVEVKTRRSDHLDTNFALDRTKIMRLCRAGAAYVKMHNLPLEVQIDAILITNHPDGTTTADHLEDIALPPRRR